MEEEEEELWRNFVNLLESQNLDSILQLSTVPSMS
jgi:hypothetical protein